MKQMYVSDLKPGSLCDLLFLTRGQHVGFNTGPRLQMVLSIKRIFINRNQYDLVLLSGNKVKKLTVLDQWLGSEIVDIKQ